MTNLDLNSLTAADLKQLQKNVVEAIAGFGDRKKSDARAALEAQAKKLRYTLPELVGLPMVRARKAAAPQYRHPENSEMTWSGRGRRPRWFVEGLAAGGSEDSMTL